MKVYKRRGSSYWYVVNGKNNKKGNRKATSLLVSLYSKREAQKIMDMAGQKAFLRSIGMKETKISLEDAIDEYNVEVIRLQGDTPHSKAIRGYVNNFVKYTKKNVQDVGDVKTSDVEDYLVYRRENNIAPSTLIKDKTFIKQFFEMCENKGYIDKGTNPCNRIRKQIIPSNNFKNQKRVNEPIPNKYLYKVMYDKSIPKKERLLWMIQRFTGFDVGNALHLKEHNINRLKLEIHCEREKSNVKTSWIPMHHELADEDIIDLQSRFNQQTVQGCIRKRLSVFRTALENIGYNKYVTFKCLRHSFNQALLENGVEDTIRQKLMGHDIKQNKTYTHVNSKPLKDAIMSMGMETQTAN